MKTLYIGCHLSASKGFLAMGKTAESLGANTFQFFTRNPRGGAAKAIDPNDIEAYRAFAQQAGFGKILAHAAYTLNACAADTRVRAFALECMTDDMVRMEHIPGQLYNFHPGSHVGQGIEKGIELIADVLNTVLRKEQTTTVLLETMAGKGSEVGGRFEELRDILAKVELTEKMGVCMDTCHVYDAGYDIVEDLDGVLDEFDRVIGLDKLRAVHINDSMHGKSSHKDRHQKIGEGAIGLEAMARVLRHPKLQGLPFLLETPNELPGYAAEIALLKGEWMR